MRKTLIFIWRTIRRFVSFGATRTPEGNCARCGEPLAPEATDCMGCWTQRQW
ncbi:MAG: hypothetical protein JNM03_09500 [Sphingopyxis sp.]|nr:hypothetical protein [Sphingopyxis sp.]